MFDFKRKKDPRKPGSAASSTASDSDLMAEIEAKEFEESVRAAMDRRLQAEAAGHAKTKGSLCADTDATKGAADSDENHEGEQEPIIWDELSDVFTPRICSLAHIDASRKLEYRPASNAQEAPAAFGFSCEIANGIWNTMHAHLREDLKNELGGLLIGTVCHDPECNTYLVKVEQALRATDGISSPTSFSYSSASWQVLGPALENLEKDQTIVGSYHSHPGMGVFLSSTDLETQSSIFPHPWQIAVVIDPVRGQFGVYVGPQGVKYHGSDKTNN